MIAGPRHLPFDATCVEVFANPKRDPLWDELVLNKPKIS
jgi:hypothetical protein